MKPAKRHRQAGSITVEFALVLPFLLLVILAIAQTGLTMSAHIMVTQAAREGARQATTADNDAEIAQAAAAAGGGGVGLKVSWSAPGGWKAGQPVTVTAASRVPCVFPALVAVWPAAADVKAASTMRLEKDR